MNQTAEEVVQDAFVAVHGHWAPLDDPERALGCLRTAVVNEARSVLRHRAVVARNVPVPDAPGADKTSLDGDRRRAVLDALRALPHRQREVLPLRHASTTPSATSRRGSGSARAQ